MRELDPFRRGLPRAFGPRDLTLNARSLCHSHNYVHAPPDSWTLLFSSGALLCQARTKQLSAGDLVPDAKTLLFGWADPPKKGWCSVRTLPSGVGPSSIVQGQTTNSDFSPDFGHFILKLFENLDILACVRKIFFKNHDF